jgi:hypothetical protein
MDTSSVVLISLLGGVMLVFAIRNIKYNKGRDLAYQAYRNTVGMLRAEFKDNLELADKVRNEMASFNLSKDKFKTQEWEKLLTGPFLAQMDEDAANDLRQIYILIEKAEMYRTQLIETSNEQPASRRLAQYRGDYRVHLSRIVDEVAIKLRTHLARVK